MNRNQWMRIGAVAVVAIGGASWWMHRPKEVSAASSPATASPVRTVAAAGRVEPYGEEVRLASELDGRLKRVLVEEGDRVRTGQVVAELDNGDFIARVSLAKATIAEREAAVERLVNGSRKQERGEQRAAVREAEVVVDNARVERDRRQQLLDRGAISRTEFDTADREYRVSVARLEAVRERQSLVDDQTRPEDLARARAEVAAARARLDEAEALLSKTIIRSPIAGVVLRKKLKAGESVSSKGEPPILTLGEVAKLRIRVDVDEHDVAKVALHQAAWVTAPAYGDRKFTGRVVQIGQALGRKNVRTDEPTERVDVKILETLVELDPGQQLPVGLRVDAFIQVK
jgi:ABC exporter DevB family membrane fusion protein